MVNICSAELTGRSLCHDRYPENRPSWSNGPVAPDRRMDAMTTTSCHDCGARPGERHRHDCDVERCSNCGRQRVSCGCPGRLRRRRLPWTGEFPGMAECREFDWFSKRVPGVGWVRCDENDP